MTDPNEDEGRRETTPSLIPPSMGRVAYAAACELIKERDPTFGDEHALLVCPWEQLTENERAAFEAAAKAVCG